MVSDVAFEHGAIRKFVNSSFFDAILVHAKLSEVVDTGTIVAALEAEPQEARLWLMGVEDDGAVMVLIRAGSDECRVVLADDLVNRPVYLLTCFRAVVDRLAAAADHRADVIAHGAERHGGWSRHDEGASESLAQSLNFSRTTSLRPLTKYLSAMAYSFAWTIKSSEPVGKVVGARCGRSIVLRTVTMCLSMSLSC